MNNRAALVGTLLIAFVSVGWAQTPSPTATPKVKGKVVASPTPTLPPEPKLPQSDLDLQGKLRCTVDGLRYEQSYKVHAHTGEKAIVHLNESGISVDVWMLPKATRMDGKDAYLLDLFLHCNTKKRHLQRHAEVILTPAENEPIDLFNKTDKDKFTVEVNAAVVSKK